MGWVKRAFSLTQNNVLIPKDENSDIRNKLLQDGHLPGEDTINLHGILL